MIIYSRSGRLTWMQLAIFAMHHFDEDQADTDVTIMIDDECYAVELVVDKDNNGTLDEWHPHLKLLKEEE